MLDPIRNLVKKSGFDVVRYQSHRMLLYFGFDLVLDVGANVGQYARELRTLGYRGRIVSFEPLSQAYAALSQKAKGDPDWSVMNCAVGDIDGPSSINMSENSYSSSLLDIHDISVDARPETKFVGSEAVEVKRLDSVFPEHHQAGQRVFLKIDTQGYEKNVIDGAPETLPLVSGLQMEMSLFPVYRGADLFDDMLKYVEDRGFRLAHVKPGFCHPESGLMLQLDAIFLREELLEQAKTS